MQGHRPDTQSEHELVFPQGSRCSIPGPLAPPASSPTPGSGQGSATCRALGGGAHAHTAPGASRWVSPWRVTSGGPGGGGAGSDWSSRASLRGEGREQGGGARSWTTAGGTELSGNGCAKLGVCKAGGCKVVGGARQGVQGWQGVQGRGVQGWGCKAGRGCKAGARCKARGGRAGQGRRWEGGPGLCRGIAAEPGRAAGGAGCWGWDVPFPRAGTGQPHSPAGPGRAGPARVVLGIGVPARPAARGCVLLTWRGSESSSAQLAWTLDSGLCPAANWGPALREVPRPPSPEARRWVPAQSPPSARPGLAVAEAGGGALGRVPAAAERGLWGLVRRGLQAGVCTQAWRAGARSRACWRS